MADGKYVYIDLNNSWTKRQSSISLLNNVDILMYFSSHTLLRTM